jgi:hypothetical protein
MAANSEPQCNQALREHVRVNANRSGGAREIKAETFLLKVIVEGHADLALY